MANFCDNQQRNIFNNYQGVEHNDNGEIRLVHIPFAHNLSNDALGHIVNLIGAPRNYNSAQLAEFLGPFNCVSWATNGYIMISVPVNLNNNPYPNDNLIEINLTLDDFNINAINEIMQVAMPHNVPNNIIALINRVPMLEYNLNTITLRLPRWHNNNNQHNMEANHIQ